MRRRAGALALTLLLAGCGNSSPTDHLNSFEEVGDALGCLQLINAGPETTDILNNKYCTLPNRSAESVGQATILQYDDQESRDKSVKAGVVLGASYLLLNKEWAISGEVSDLMLMKSKLGGGELRQVLPEESPPPVEEEDAPESVEPTTEVEGPKLVPFGSSATSGGEEVKIDRLRCDEEKKAEFVSCRETNLGKIAPNPDYDGDASGDVPEFLAAKAESGDEFYLVAVEWKNAGKKPIRAGAFGTLVTAGGAEFESDSVYEQILTQNTKGNEDVDTTETFNPGKGFRIILCYAIPKGTKVVSVNWGLDVDGEAPKYTLAVK